MSSYVARPKKQLKIVATLLLILIAVELLNLLLGRGLNVFGIYPRQTFGLRGIVLAPWLHGSVQHFASNIITLAVFSLLMLQYGTGRFIKVSVFILLSSGLLVWLLARPAMHIGASGIIYGYLGFLLFGGLRSGRIKLVLISLIVAGFYGGLIFGVLPSRTFVSWESHMFGFVSGLAAAYLWVKR